MKVRLKFLLLNKISCQRMLLEEHVIQAHVDNGKNSVREVIRGKVHYTTETREVLDMDVLANDGEVAWRGI